MQYNTHIMIYYTQKNIKNLLDKLQEDSLELSKKLEMMQYAIVGFIEHNSDAYFFEDFHKEIVEKFSDIQDEIEIISQEEYRQRLNIS